jgi:perosamine synthetase
MLTSGGQGGMLVSADRSLVDAVRDYREFDCRRDRTPRFNFQMTDLQAAIGRAQLSQLDRFIDARRRTHGEYAAAGLPLWSFASGPGIERCHYRAILRGGDTAALTAGFERDGVGAIVPILDWELLGDAEDFPCALSLARNAVSIPIHPSLTQDEIAQVARVASVLYSSAGPASS